MSEEVCVLKKCSIGNHIAAAGAMGTAGCRFLGISLIRLLFAAGMVHACVCFAACVRVFATLGVKQVTVTSFCLQDMEKWAKAMNAQKDAIKEELKKGSCISARKESAAADAGFSIMQKSVSACLQGVLVFWFLLDVFWIAGSNDC